MSGRARGQFPLHNGRHALPGQGPGDLRQGKIKVATKSKPTQAELDDAYFATKFCKHTKSNAISIAKELQLVGNGAGQMSRVDACKIAMEKARRFGLRPEGTTAASDAFFPFRDAVDELAEAGITCIVQPGGSVRDAEAIAAADEHGISMVFTGRRHFKH